MGSTIEHALLYIPSTVDVSHCFYKSVTFFPTYKYIYKVMWKNIYENAVYEFYIL